MEEDITPPLTPRTFFQQYGSICLFSGLSFFCISAALVLLVKTTQSSEPIRFSDNQDVASSSSRMLIVDIEGAVEKPGVYELPDGSRIEDLLQKAGGVTSQADSEWIAKTLNRASLLTDGAKVFILKKGESQSTAIPSGNQTAGAQTQSFAGISINTASQSELESLPGIGPVTAGKVISGRPYLRLEELVERKIIGSSVFEKIKGQITL